MQFKTDREKEAGTENRTADLMQGRTRLLPVGVAGRLDMDALTAMWNCV